MKQTILTLVLVLTTHFFGVAQTFVDAEIFRFASGVHFTPSLKVDSLGNIFLSGAMGNDNFTSGQEFGPFEFYNTNIEDGYVLKLNPNLDVQWVRPVVGVGLNGEPSDNRVDDIIPWGNGGVLVKPSNFGLTEGGDTLYNLGNSPLLELSEPGSLISAHFAPFGNNGSLEYVGGDTVLVLSTNLIKHSFSTGTLWQFPVTSSAARYFYGLTKGGNGSAYVVGNYYESELELNGITLPFSQNSRGFIAKVESDGSLAWLRGLDSPESNCLFVTYNPIADEVTVGGYFNDWVLDENQNVIGASNSSDMLLATFDSNGTLEKILTGSGWIGGMTSDEAGHLFVLASFGGPAQLGGSGIDEGRLLIKFGADLEPMWIKDINMSFGTRGLVHIDPTNQDIIVTGEVPNFQEVQLDDVVIPLGTDESNIVVARISDDSTSTFVSGKVFIDSNSNGVLDQGESGLPSYPVEVGGQTIYTGQDGTYSRSIAAGVHSISVEPLINYWAFEPNHIEIATDTIGLYVGGLNFAVVPVEPTQDLSVSVSSTLPPRPGFLYQQYITVTNIGTVTTDGELVFTIDSELDTVNISSEITAGAGDTLIWDFESVAPLSSISIVLNTLVPETATLGDSTSCFYEVRTLGEDESPMDNEQFFTEEIVGSYDPNDKLCDLEAAESVEQVHEGLTYTIRFQNTGTYFAQDVRIVDTISPLLDFNSIQTLGASHEFFVERESDNVIKWVFPSIFLPDSASDFDGSQGFVTFTALPSEEYDWWGLIENSAAIYFDFNEPIITDVVGTYVLYSNVEEHEVKNEWLIWPNPTNGGFFIKVKESMTKPDYLEMFDLAGSLVLSQHYDKGYVDVSNLSAGTYLIRITGKENSEEHKLVIMP